ncbi:MAG: ArsA family ATPase [Acidimicrobiales bacterium]
MDVGAWCRQCRILIVAGKGGVGKTTVSAALALTASRAGLDVLVVQLEGRGGVAGFLGHPEDLGYDEVVLREAEGHSGAVRARAITPDDALVEYLTEHGLGRVLHRLLSSGALDVIATAVPGIRDILVLGKVKQLERAGVADLVVLDAPAAGHTLTFLSSAEGLLDVARVGPIRVQAGEVHDLLADPGRCQVLLVTLPEETPVNEVVETAFRLEDKVGTSLGPVVVNGLYPPLVGLDVDPAEAAATSGASVGPGHAEVLREAALFRQRRQQLQAEQVARLADALPLAQLRLPYLFTADIGVAEVEVLARALATAVAGLAPPPAAGLPEPASQPGAGQGH